MKKILIFYASYGGGHLNAAKSIYEYITNNYNKYDIEMIDCMKYVNKTIEKITTAAYREAAKKKQLHIEKLQKKCLGFGDEFIMILKKVLWHIYLLGQIK